MTFLRSVPQESPNMSTTNRPARQISDLFESASLFRTFQPAGTTHIANLRTSLIIVCERLGFSCTVRSQIKGKLVC